MKTKFAFLIAALLIVGACSVTSKGSGETMKPAEASGGLFGLVTKDNIEVDNGDAFKGKNQVILGSFKVGFIEDKAASAKAGSGFGGRAKANTTLKNIDTALEQQITDAAYADFVAQMQAAGITLLDRSQLTGSKEWDGINGDAAPYKQEPGILGGIQMTFLAPSQLEQKIYWHGESGNTGGFGFGNPSVAAGSFAARTNVPVIFVSYIIDFANHEGSGGSFSTYSSVEVGQGISVPAGFSGLTFFGGQGSTFSNPNGSIKFGQAVYSEEPYGDVVNTTSEANLAGQYALNVMSLMMGAGSNQTRSFDFNADPAKFAAVTGKVLADANGKLASQMGALK